MKAPGRNRLREWATRSGRVGLVALLAWVILAGIAPGAAAPAFRFAVFACLQPALGCLIFALIHRLTGGQWGEALRPFLAAGVRLLPWIWPWAAVLLLIPSARPSLAGSDLAHATVPAPGALLIRAVAYEGVFLILRAAALREGGRRFAGPALICLVFTLHFLAADWFFTLDPEWYSSGFPVVWMTVAAAAGLSWCIVMAAAAGRSPAASGSSGRVLGLDWGDLILATVIFSSYVAFVQFLIIWAGDLPREISWYLQRSRGLWRGVAIALALFYLAFPAGFMFFRDFKRSRRGVPAIAWVLCSMQVLWAAWLILPVFSDRGPFLPFLCVFALAAGAGLFANRYLTIVLRAEETT